MPTVTIGGKEWRLRYDFNAIADAEEKVGLGIGAMFSDDRAGLSSIRLLVWAGPKWRERGLTIERAGSMIEEYMVEGGSLEVLMEKVRIAMQQSGLLQFKKVEAEEGNPIAETE